MHLEGDEVDIGSAAFPDYTDVIRSIRADLVTVEDSAGTHDCMDELLLFHGIESERSDLEGNRAGRCCTFGSWICY